MNKQSSRSHCLFTIAVKAKVAYPDGSMEVNGKLHMVDLAGSECAKSANLDSATSSSSAARERERMNINRSLLTLGRVISCLKEQTEKKNSTVRVPYRDSKLTRVLQESLGGRCKTVIIATLSPSDTAIEESISTLNYAQSANGIVNKPVATSYLTVGKGDGGQYSGESDAAGSQSLQHWHEMECKLQYVRSRARREGALPSFLGSREVKVPRRRSWAPPRRSRACAKRRRPAGVPGQRNKNTLTPFLDSTKKKLPSSLCLLP
jgi:kinesin family protein 11